MTRDDDSPILKIGAVVLRAQAVPLANSPLEGESKRSFSVSVGGDAGEEIPPTKSPKSDLAPPQGGSYGACGTTHDILILQPIPKHAGEVPHFVLPRGSRQYQDADGAWHDARDAATGAAFRATLEPYARGLAREVEEEAGVTPEMLARASVRALGVLDFQSRSKGVYPIYWYVVELAEADAAGLTETLPVDALSVRWATLDEIQQMAASGEFSAGYVSVIEAALAVVA